MSYNSYDQYIGSEVVLTDKKVDKTAGKVRNHIKYYDISIGEGHYIAMHDKSVYEVKYTDGTTVQLEANIIAQNMISKIDFEGHHYQALTELTDHKRDDIAITKVYGFIKSSNGNLHWERTACGWKLLVEWKDLSVKWVPLK